jgi:two-component system sensor histidine kinase ChiS
VSQETVKKRARVPVLELLIILVLSTTACSGLAVPVSSEPAIGPTEAVVTAAPTFAPANTASTGGSQAAVALRPRRAQDNDVRFERISLEQGLSQSVVLCMLQDSQGFMWFGTQDGLNRYDGYDFVVYKHDPEDPHSLSDGFVRSIYEDRSGALWIGTNTGGLDRLDREGAPGAGAEQFTHYQNDPDDPHSLSNDNVQSIYEDRAGVLWVGTLGGGLNRFDREAEQFTHYQNDPNDPHSLSNNSVSSIYEDQAGVLWVGTNGGGLDRLDRETGYFIHYRNDPDDPHSLSNDNVLSIYEDRAGVLWIGTFGGGLDRFDRDQETFAHYRADPDNPHSLSSDNVQAIYEGQAGVLWIGTGDGGLDRLVPSTGSGQALSEAEGFDRETEQFVHYRNDPGDPYSLSNDDVRSIYESQAGVLWVGTFGGGLNKHDRDTEQFARYQNDPDDPHSLSNDVVWSIYQDGEGVLWIGTNGGGLNRFDRETEQFTHYQNDPDDPHSLSDDVVWSVYQDREGVLWVGTNAGLDRFDRETEQFVHYPTFPVLSMCQDREGTLWIGTLGGGLGTFDRESVPGAGAGQFVYYQNDPDDPHSLSDNAVVSVYEDREGVLWIGTFNGGLDRLDREGAPGAGAKQFVHYANDPGDPHSLSHNSVLSIYQDREGVLWVGTAGGGLNKLVPSASSGQALSEAEGLDRATGTFTRYTEKDGLPNDYVYGILEDDVPLPGGGHNLWLSTNKGLSQFNPQTETFKNYDVRDGLQSNEFNMSAYHKSSSGEMFFGGIHGFNAFYPHDVTDNPAIPPIVITDFQLFNEPVAVGGDSPLQKPIAETDEIRLSYQDDFFSFEFAALHYAAPEENQYAYMMEGLDKDWNYVGTRRFAGYTSVPPGEYTFRVKGSNSDGVWNEEGASVKVIIAPPFWQTWWFRISMAALVVGGVFGAFTLRVRAIEAQRRHLEVQVNERTKELRETLVQLERSKEAAEAANRAKSIFLANMSHEFRTPLNAILGFTQLMNRDTSLAAEQQENLGIISRSGEHLLGLINDVLELSKIEAGRATLNEQSFDLHHLLHGLEEMFRLRAEDEGLTLIFDRAPDVPQYVRADEGKLRQVLMNLLGNAVKFTQEGSVALRVRYLAGQPASQPTGRLHFSVEDTGPGIAPEEMAAVFDPFVQTASGQRSQEGTGLGLPISQQFARLMGGDLTVRSELGQGSTFQFEVPVEVLDASGVQAAQPTRRVIGLEPGQRTYRLLIVDDKEVNRKLMVRMLTDLGPPPLGFEVREAVNGQEAIEIWERWEPHLIWMDMRMPVMDGYEATRRIKATIKGQATVIVALTASALEEDRVIMLSEGCDDYMRKPFREADLFDALARHLGVRFVYQEVAQDRERRPRIPGEPSQGAPALTAGDLELVERMAALSPDWVADLREATILGDLGLILARIERIREQDAALAEALAALAHDFDHDKILALIQQAGAQR